MSSSPTPEQTEGKKNESSSSEEKDQATPRNATKDEEEDKLQAEEWKEKDASSISQIIYCTCRHATLCSKCGIPMNTKDDTKKAIDALIVEDRPPLANVFGNGPLIVSDIPKSTINNAEVVLGIE